MPPESGARVVLKQAKVHATQRAHGAPMRFFVIFVVANQVMDKTHATTPFARVGVDDVPEILADVLFVVPASLGFLGPTQIKRCWVLQRR